MSSHLVQSTVLIDTHVNVTAKNLASEQYLAKNATIITTSINLSRLSVRLVWSIWTAITHSLPTLPTYPPTLPSFTVHRLTIDLIVCNLLMPSADDVNVNTVISSKDVDFRGNGVGSVRRCGGVGGVGWSMGCFRSHSRCSILTQQVAINDNLFYNSLRFGRFLTKWWRFLTYLLASLLPQSQYILSPE